MWTVSVDSLMKTALCGQSLWTDGDVDDALVRLRPCLFFDVSLFFQLNFDSLKFPGTNWTPAQPDPVGRLPIPSCT